MADIPSYLQNQDAPGGTSNATIDPNTGVDKTSGVPGTGDDTKAGTVSPLMITSGPAQYAVQSSSDKLEDLTNPNSDYYKNNPYFLRPGEDNQTYLNRTQPDLKGGTGEEKKSEDQKNQDKEKNDLIEKNPDAAAHVAKADEYTKDAQKVQADLDSIRAGTYTNPTTLALIQSITDSFNRAFDAQLDVNNRTLAGFTQAGIRSGRSRYAPEIEAGNLNKVASAGVEKLTAIADKKAVAIAKAQTARDQQDFNNLFKEMQNFEKLSADETKEATATLKAVQAEAKAADAKQKANLQNTKTQQAIDEKEAEQHAYTVLDYLDSNSGGKGESSLEEDKKAVEEYAGHYGLDASLLLNEVEKLKMTKDKYGSGPLGQYQFYSEHEKHQGNTPKSYEDFNKDQHSKNAGAKAKDFKFNPKQLTSLESRGLKEAEADGILQDIKAGFSDEKIRENMKTGGIDPGLLDEIYGYIRPAKGASNSQFK